MRVNKRGLKRALNELFAKGQVTVSCPAGVVRKGREPVAVGPFVRKHVRATDPGEKIFDNQSPLDIVERVAEIQLLHALEWTPRPIGWKLTLGLLRLSAERTLVTYISDCEEVQLTSFIAALEPGYSDELLTLFLKDLFYGNGEKYGVTLKGSLLDAIWVCYTPKEANLQAFWPWLKWSEKEWHSGWAELASDLIEVYERAGSGELIRQQFFNTSFAEVMPSALGEKWRAVVEERRRYKRHDKRLGEVLTDGIRRLLLDYYLAVSAFWRADPTPSLR